jgi:hypothetical protein
MKHATRLNVYLSEPQAEAFAELAASEDLTNAALSRKIFAFYFQSHGYEWPGRVE